ncbi:petrobactin biosynthesis protein AsbD [Shouchella patagoniensis]|uniref:petrobactin biosynthesis protein AsbD n=1 Tax=Shouchella patagoniensis TaxID=228576 RepID=UPI0009957D73|nr:petrobactin biosynthesis protein AsbD [Shouchella patagoniensis]
MTYKEAVSAIYEILKTELQINTLESFHEDARLNEDLAIDSVMMLQILLQLEMDYGIEIPDEKIERDSFFSVRTLAQFLELQGQSEPTHD